MQNSGKISCEQIEKILINQKIDNISEEERQILITHLDSCERCKNSQVVFDEIRTVVNIEQNSELIPKPEIRESLLDRMKAKKPVQTNFLGNFLNKLRTVFSYRIPVYQAAIGLISLFLIFLALEKLPSQNSAITPNEKAFNQKSELFISQTNVRDSLNILNQKIGLNVSEDTVFTKYINATM